MLVVDRFADAEEFLAFFKANYGPTIAVYARHRDDPGSTSQLDDALLAWRGPLPLRRAGHGVGVPACHRRGRPDRERHVRRLSFAGSRSALWRQARCWPPALRQLHPRSPCPSTPRQTCWPTAAARTRVRPAARSRRTRPRPRRRACGRERPTTTLSTSSLRHDHEQQRHQRRDLLQHRLDDHRPAHLGGWEPSSHRAGTSGHVQADTSKPTSACQVTASAWVT